MYFNFIRFINLKVKFSFGILMFDIVYNIIFLSNRMICNDITYNIKPYFFWALRHTILQIFIRFLEEKKGIRTYLQKKIKKNKILGLIWFNILDLSLMLYNIRIMIDKFILTRKL